MVQLSKNNLLTINFINTTDAVTMQYVPDDLRRSDSVLSNTQPTLGGLVTYVGYEDTAQSTISLATTLTAIESAESDAVKTGAAVAVVSGAAIAGQISPLEEMVKYVGYATSVISLARGSFDLASGTFSPSVSNLNSAGPNRDQITKLRTLRKHMVKGTPCSLTWDLETEDKKYIIKSMETTAQRIQKASGATLIYSINMQLIQAGGIIIKSNG